MLQYGAINTSAGLPLARRLVQIEQDLTQLIRQFQPDEIAIEELFFSKNITTGIAVAHGRGVILCTAEKMGVPIYEYTPMQVKQAVVGYGLAEKKQVMDMTAGICGSRTFRYRRCRAGCCWPSPSAPARAGRACGGSDKGGVRFWKEDDSGRPACCW